MTHLIPPHGGELKDLRLAAEAAQAARQAAVDYPSWDLTARQLCDLELLAVGGFSPLDGFLGQADYQRVLADMRLEDGTLWPMPVTLDVSERFAEGIAVGDHVALRDPEGVVLAILHVTDHWRPDPTPRRGRFLALTTRRIPVWPISRSRVIRSIWAGRLRCWISPLTMTFPICE